jgi:hypothetical protein
MRVAVHKCVLSVRAVDTPLASVVFCAEEMGDLEEGTLGETLAVGCWAARDLARGPRAAPMGSLLVLIAVVDRVSAGRAIP